MKLKLHDALSLKNSKFLILNLFNIFCYKKTIHYYSGLSNVFQKSDRPTITKIHLFSPKLTRKSLGNICFDSKHLSYLDLSYNTIEAPNILLPKRLPVLKFGI